MEFRRVFFRSPSRSFLFASRRRHTSSLCDSSSDMRSSALLLDEIEKAHPDVFNILLQILEDGKLTDAQGRKVDFRNTIVIMTSNIGASTISKNQTLGFSVGDDSGLSYDEMKDRIMGELKKVFRPELLNRIDEVIVFHK